MTILRYILIVISGLLLLAGVAGFIWDKVDKFKENRALKRKVK